MQCPTLTEALGQVGGRELVHFRGSKESPSEETGGLQGQPRQELQEGVCALKMATLVRLKKREEGLSGRHSTVHVCVRALTCAHFSQTWT